MYILYKNSFKFRESITENINIGQDDTHRGTILGMLAGAANSSIPQDMKEELPDYKNINHEINDFVKLLC